MGTDDLHRPLAANWLSGNLTVDPLTDPKPWRGSTARQGPFAVIWTGKFLPAPMDHGIRKRAPGGAHAAITRIVAARLIPGQLRRQPSHGERFWPLRECRPKVRARARGPAPPDGSDRL